MTQPGGAAVDGAAATGAASAPRLGGPGVFGVMSIVFGSIMLLMDLTSSCGVACSRDLEQLDLVIKGDARTDRAKLRRAAEQYHQAIFAPTLVSTALHLVLSGLLIALGVGQLRRRRWAGQATLWWSAAALLALAISTALHFLVLRPAMQRYLAVQLTELTGVEAQAARLGGQIGGVMALVLTALALPYPLLLAIYFSRPRVRAALTT